MNERNPETEREPEATLRIERLVPGGHGFVRRADGEALLVPGALPGDRIELLREGRKRGAGRAEEWRLVEPSADRIEPVCEVATECGGCDLMALSEPAQQRAKLALFADALERFAHLDPALVPRALTRAGSVLVPKLAALVLGPRGSRRSRLASVPPHDPR